MLLVYFDGWIMKGRRTAFEFRRFSASFANSQRSLRFKAFDLA